MKKKNVIPISKEDYQREYLENGISTINPVRYGYHTHKFTFSEFCGCSICTLCQLHAHLEENQLIKGKTIHQELVRCYCGWSAFSGLGEDGRKALLELGETLEPEQQ